MDLSCFHCKKTNSFQSKIGYREECSHCSSDLHVCKNCQFYDVKSYNECREPSAEVLREKERANYCDFFEGQNLNGQAVVDEKAKLKAAAEALFKKQ